MASMTSGKVNKVREAAFFLKTWGGVKKTPILNVTDLRKLEEQGCCAHSGLPAHAMDTGKLLAAGTVPGCWVEGRDCGYKKWD